MIAVDFALVEAAKEAGMKVPENLEDYGKDKYPHWFVYTEMQLGASMPYAGVHWDNAKVVAELSDKEIKTITPEELKGRGFLIGFNFT